MLLAFYWYFIGYILCLYDCFVLCCIVRLYIITIAHLCIFTIFILSFRRLIAITANVCISSHLISSPSHLISSHLILARETIHGWPSTQPGNLHTALQRKHTAVLIVLPGHGCVNNGATAVWTMGHGCVQVPGCVEGHPCDCRALDSCQQLLSNIFSETKWCVDSERRQTRAKSIWKWNNLICSKWVLHVDALFCATTRINSLRPSAEYMRRFR